MWRWCLSCSRVRAGHNARGGTTGVLCCSVPFVLVMCVLCVSSCSVSASAGRPQRTRRRHRCVCCVLVICVLCNDHVKHTPPDTQKRQALSTCVRFRQPGPVTQRGRDDQQQQQQGFDQAQQQQSQQGLAADQDASEQERLRHGDVHVHPIDTQELLEEGVRRVSGEHEEALMPPPVGACR